MIALTPLNVKHSTTGPRQLSITSQQPKNNNREDKEHSELNDHTFNSISKLLPTKRAAGTEIVPRAVLISEIEFSKQISHLDTWSSYAFTY